MEIDRIHERLKERFPDAVKEMEKDGDARIVVEAAAIAEVCAFLRDDPELKCDYLTCLSGLDYEKRMGVVYNIYSFEHRHMVNLKVYLDRDKPAVPTVEGVWKIANWFEREAFDLYGIHFQGHSDLRRLLLPDDWEGHPMRKDWQYPPTYHGVPL